LRAKNLERWGKIPRLFMKDTVLFFFEVLKYAYRMEVLLHNVLNCERERSMIKADFEQ
jgi:hypothetical protein